MRLGILITLMLTGSLAAADTVESAEIRRSVDKSLALLQSTGSQFFRKSGCISCHGVSLPLMAVSIARERGFKVDDQAARQMVKGHVALLTPFRENLFQTNCTVPGMATTATYSLIAMKDEKYPRDKLTDAVVHCLATMQRPEGYWAHGDDIRPPLGNSDFVSTALSLRTLDIYGMDGRKAELQAQIERARNWLIKTAPRTTDDRVWKLMGLRWSGASAKDSQQTVKLLMQEQRSDGGWSQLPEMPSDAFATGSVLAALHYGGKVPVTDSAYSRGTAFLLRTQQDDGSWHVKTRAFGFQPYFESGFPHGHDQWISSAATAWATMALTYAATPGAK